MPSTFVSDVKDLPVNLDRDYRWWVGRWSEREDRSLPLLECVHWEPERRRTLRGRVSYYRLLIDEGICSNVREAVKATAVKRREWEAAETARHAERLARKIEDEHRTLDSRELARRKKNRVLAQATSCTYCGIRDPRTVDHVTPTARGGDDRRRNLTPACHKCNAEKGNRTPEQWREDRLSAGLSWPPGPGSNQWTLPLPSPISSVRVSPPQVEVLTALAKTRLPAVRLAWAEPRTLQALERHRLIVKWDQDERFHRITARGRLALEAGRIPR